MRRGSKSETVHCLQPEDTLFFSSHGDSKVIIISGKQTKNPIKYVCYFYVKGISIYLTNYDLHIHMTTWFEANCSCVWLEGSGLSLWSNYIKPLFEDYREQRGWCSMSRKEWPNSRRRKVKRQTSYSSPRCWDLCIMFVQHHERWRDLGRERNGHALKSGTDPTAQLWWQPLNKWWNWGPSDSS